MRILSYEIDKAFDEIFVYLTPNEEKELVERLNGLTDDHSIHHIHLDTDELNGQFKKMLTIAIYTEDNLDDFDERSKKLILEDK